MGHRAGDFRDEDQLESALAAPSPLLVDLGRNHPRREPCIGAPIRHRKDLK